MNEEETYFPHKVFCQEQRCCYNCRGECTVQALRDEGELIPCYGGHN